VAQIASHPVEPIDDITLVDLAIVLAKRKKLVLGLPLIGALLAIVVTLVLPDVYTATGRILPPQQKESSAAAMLGVFAGVTGGPSSAIGQALGLRNPNELYVGILKGHTIADRLIERFNLKELYKAETMVNARESLDKVTKITAGKDGLITIDVDDKDPKRAAALANAYVEELGTLMQGLALTEASQRRLFFENQLASARGKLVDAELNLRIAIDTKGITGVDAQTRGVVGTAEQLRAQVAVKEIQLDAMRSFATDRNPDAVRLRQEIVSIKTELGQLEGGRRAHKNGESPAGLESLRKLREVKFLEFNVELLTKQFELAKIDEAKDAVLIQVVDPAIPPDFKSKPKRSLIVILTALMLGVIAVLWAFLANAVDRANEDPNAQGKLQSLLHNLRWR
jgi:tyrosine-protein kinase Etk/Wzc